MQNTVQDTRCHAKHAKCVNTMQDAIFLKGIKLDTKYHAKMQDTMLNVYEYYARCNILQKDYARYKAPC